MCFTPKRFTTKILREVNNLDDSFTKHKFNKDDEESHPLDGVYYYCEMMERYPSLGINYWIWKFGDSYDWIMSHDLAKEARMKANAFLEFERARKLSIKSKGVDKAIDLAPKAMDELEKIMEQRKVTPEKLKAVLALTKPFLAYNEAKMVAMAEESASEGNQESPYPDV